MELLLIILYVILGYWAVGKTIYSKTIFLGNLKDMFLTRFILGALFGFVLIPVAIVRKLLHI